MQTDGRSESPADRVDEPVLSVRGVRKSYGGGIYAVDSVSFDVFGKEILGLLGSSGCGKTTTLRLIAGLERCDDGEIFYGGEPMDSKQTRTFVPTNRRNIGMVFQSYAIWPHMSVYENVAYGAKLRNKGRAGKQATKQAVEHALEMVGLGAYAQRSATALSGGQQQRVAVARALAYEPRLLLLDEPFSNLDAKRRESMRAEFKVLQRELGIPTILVTHDQHEALSLSDRIAIMEAGKIEQIGRPTDLYRFPVNSHVRDFVGDTVLVQGKIEYVAADDYMSMAIEGAQNHVIGRVARGQKLRAGDLCWAAIRPENIVGSLDSDGSSIISPAADNAYSARMLAVLFMGDHYQVQVRLPWGQESLVRLPATTAWIEGNYVSLQLLKERVRFWPA